MAETPAPHAPASGDSAGRPDSAPAPPSANHNNNVATIAAAVCVTLTLLIVVGLYVLRKRVFRLLEAQRGGGSSPRKGSQARLSLEDLETMPVMRYKVPPQQADVEAGTLGDDESGPCSICTESFLVGARLRKLPCGHRFHTDCVDPWLLDRSATCPIWYG
ncbi:hypothetical protein JDV02_009724 [Purpureocillium takamizusanense]|uniref:RING-type domain-containing protein n=1 Tax=Purpureocillium takamizusanense TaxID=2060973 RepID=A0A9Q8QMJ9_9HYPO|nr:uncharacterized protein JDV02_009724 [Purpureocillium takamizusanense]UNI23934.1 hypothetical protein JDV02_009724 [Purpureocillium takamizusanense]